MLAEVIYENYGREPIYRPSRFDVVGGAPHDVVVNSADDDKLSKFVSRINESYGNEVLVVGSGDNKMRRSSTTVDPRLTNLFGSLSQGVARKGYREGRRGKTGSSQAMPVPIAEVSDEIPDWCPGGASTICVDSPEDVNIFDLLN